jgi:beta-phosphoglucomutase-like phosphatase (HAD superfamily)
VVTGSGQHTLLDKLLGDFDGLLREELIVTAFDVTHGKPNPEPYQIGMQKCGVAPWETIVVENAPLGVRAAVAAQCFTIAVNTGPLPNEMLAQEGANLIFPRMTDLAEAYHRWYPSACHG